MSPTLLSWAPDFISGQVQGELHRTGICVSVRSLGLDVSNTLECLLVIYCYKHSLRMSALFVISVRAPSRPSQELQGNSKVSNEVFSSEIWSDRELEIHVLIKKVDAGSSGITGAHDAKNPLSNTPILKNLIINILNFIFTARSVHWQSLVERHIAIVLCTRIVENMTNVKYEICGIKGTKPSD